MPRNHLTLNKRGDPLSSNSIKTAPRGKTQKPQKPYDGFPLFAHASGRWAKKINGKFCYFGYWATRSNGKLVRVEGDGWREALLRYKRTADDLHAGQEPEPRDGCEMRSLLNAFLTSKNAKRATGELSPQSFSEYLMTTDKLVEFFGKTRNVDKLKPTDFEGYRAWLAKGRAIVTLKNEINRARIIFKFAHDQRMIREPVAYGQSFDKPSAMMLRKARNEAGPKLFTRDELKRILAEADMWLHAMVLLALNGGLGNTDIANLPQSAIDFEDGWLDYPRPKTAIQRRIPLWRETIVALKEAIATRPRPKDPQDRELVFLTVQGNRWVRTVPHKSRDGRFVTRNTVTSRFGNLLRNLNIGGRKRLGFYTIRHVFETVASESRDQVAVDAIMGHVDQSMAAHYRESISDERLQAVVDQVRAWLFESEDKT